MDLTINKQTFQGPFSSQKLWAFPDFVAAAPGTTHFLSWAAGRNSHINLQGSHAAAGSQEASSTAEAAFLEGAPARAQETTSVFTRARSGSFLRFQTASWDVDALTSQHTGRHWQNRSRCRDYRRNYWLPKNRSWWWKAWSFLRTKVNELQFRSLFLAESFQVPSALLQANEVEPC